MAWERRLREGREGGAEGGGGRRWVGGEQEEEEGREGKQGEEKTVAVTKSDERMCDKE